MIVFSRREIRIMVAVLTPYTRVSTDFFGSIEHNLSQPKPSDDILEQGRNHDLAVLSDSLS